MLVRICLNLLAMAWLASSALPPSAAAQHAPSAHADMDTARIDWMIRLVRQDCGSCHGLTLNGGLGPALTAQALQGKTPQYLTLVIQQGIPGTPMPGWRPMLTDAEASWIATQLIQGFPQE